MAPALLLSLIWLTLASSQAPATQPAAAMAFPAAWAGRWTGPATAVNLDGKRQEFGMELAVAPTDDPNRFTWEIVYIFNGKRQVRPYEIVAVDPTRGRFQIDEKNSIKIDACLVDGVLMSQFKVQSSNITATYRVQRDELIVELITFNSDRPAMSGGEANAPRVHSFPAMAIQRGVLKRSS